MSFRDLPSPPEPTPERGEDLEAQIAELEMLLGPFESAQFTEIARTISDELAAQTAQFASAEAKLTTEQVWQLRGRVQALTWVLGLPEKIRRELQSFLDQLAETTQESEGD